MINKLKTNEKLTKEIEELKIENQSLRVNYEKDTKKTKETNSAFQLRYDRENELKELKNRFISMVSHELRTPLTSIISSSDFLEMAGQNYDNEKKAKHFARIQRNADYMLNMLNKVLTINKMDSNKNKVVAVKTNIPDFCAALFNEIQILYPTVKSELVINLKDIFQNVDEVLLKNILGNLISNAFKYNTEFGQVTFKVNLINNNLVFNISDTGIGIPQEEQNDIFKPFSRMSNSLEIKGTGLGLRIVKGSVQKLGGEISFKSQENVGSSFTVFIPIMNA